MKCLSRRKLADYQVGRLSQEERARVQRHLETCPRCQVEAQALEDTARLLRPMPTVEPPADLWARVSAQLTPRPHRVPWVGRRPTWQPALAGALALLIVLFAVFALPVLHGGAKLPLAPAGDIAVRAQLSAAWDNPLSDKAALGLAMLATTQEESSQEVMD